MGAESRCDRVKVATTRVAILRQQKFIMTATAFLSYAHADVKALDRLHKHLAMLKREGALKAWTDHGILPGDGVDGAISAQLEESTIFVALVSPDYLASRYCYEKEFERALALAQAGRMRIIPVILEPCDWLSSPLKEFLALPKDGLAVSGWTNQNNAFLDVVTGLRRILTMPDERRESGPEFGSAAAPPRAGAVRQPRIKQDFDAIQRADFADKTFAVIQDYFRASCDELMRIEDLRARFEVMDSTAFTCTVVNRGRLQGGEAHITVHNGKGRSMGFGGDISYVNQRYAEANTSNGSIRVEHDDYNLFLAMDHLGSSAREKEKITPEQAAARLWTEFVMRAGIEYN